MAGPGRSVLDWPTGLTVYDRDRCWPGYTLFAPFSSPIVYLIDMNGEVVHMWFTAMGPQDRMTVVVKYIGNGHLLLEAKFSGVEAWGAELPPSQGTWLREMDWNGNVVWEYTLSGPPEDPHNARETLGWDPLYRPLTPHHDFQRLPNGNTLLLAAEWVTDQNISDCELKRSDYFLEVTPDGTPVWVWHSNQHFDEFGFSEEAQRLIRKAPGIHMGLALGDYVHTNTLEVLPETDLAKRDDRFRAGNILSCQRNTNTIFIVDKESGAVVWTWGRDHLVGPHHPNMLPNGNIIVYDNGGLGGYPRRMRTYTRLVELNPVSGEVVWTYMHDARRFHHHKFFSPTWGSVQRLPNGNTFSLNANLGRLFEVTPDGEIVWEYVNGFMGMSHLGGIKRLESGVYRCYRIPYEAVPDFSSDFARNVDGPATLFQHPPIA